jgi:hypothetical protein
MTDFISTCLLQTDALWISIASVDSSAQARLNRCGFMRVMITDEKMPFNYALLGAAGRHWRLAAKWH